MPSPGCDLSEEIQQFPGQGRLIHEQARDVAAGPRVARNESSLDGIDFEVDSHDGDRARGADGGADGGDAGGEEDIDVEPNEIGRERRHRLRLLSAKSILQRDRPPLDIAELAQSFAERADTPNGLVDGAVTEDAHRRDSGRLLGLSGERRGEETEGASDEGAPVHYWITSSARASTDGGIVRPSALAVFRLITSSNFVGCSTGRSAGLAPLRILST